MKYKTLARLALKLIGVFLIASAIPEVVNTAISFVALWVDAGGGYPGWWLIASGLGFAAKVAVGLYLLFGGRWLVDRLIPSNRPYCHECAYELTGLPPEGVCPECGTAYRRDDSGVVSR
jgi:hypothetical protein